MKNVYLPQVQIIFYGLFPHLQIIGLQHWQQNIFRNQSKTIVL